MIVRVWHGRTTEDLLPAYLAHLTSDVFPALAKLAGFRGARVLRREVDGELDVAVHTRWDSLAHIEAFAGADLGRAVVPPEARAVLTGFDEVVHHYEVVAEAPTG